MVPRDQSGIEPCLGKRRMRDQALQKSDVGRDADDAVLRKRVAETAQRLGSIGAGSDELGEHRIVEAADLVAVAHAAVDAHVFRRRWRAQVGDSPGRRQETAIRILGVDPGLDRVAGDRDLVLPARQALAGRDPQLPLDQVEAGDHLGDRMLDLQAGVHFHEIECAGARGLDDELDGAGADVTDRLCRCNRRGAHFGAPPALIPGAGASSTTF